jgi:hypothetical protein
MFGSAGQPRSAPHPFVIWSPELSRDIVKKAFSRKRAASRESLSADSSGANTHAADARSPLALGGIPRTDPAYAILADIINVVPTSAWSFARVANNGDVLAANDAEMSVDDLAALVDEFWRQRATTPRGPRIAATLRCRTDADLCRCSRGLRYHDAAA